MKPWISALFVALAVSPAAAEVTLTEQENNAIRVEIDGEFFTEYRYEPGFFPILYPVIGPSGESVTRHFPMKEGVRIWIRCWLVTSRDGRFIPAGRTGTWTA